MDTFEVVDAPQQYYERSSTLPRRLNGGGNVKGGVRKKVSTIYVSSMY
jgi:hypothetical protein